MKQIKTTFAGGELSEALDGRVDLSKYPTGAQLLENFYVTRFGGISNRQGTKYIAEANSDVRLVPFRFNVTQTYVLEFGESIMRVLKDGGVILTDYDSPAGFKWTQSPSTATEWYCELTAGGDPSIAGALSLFVDDVEYTSGILGFLSAGKFAYGDNDTLGYNTIYMYSATDPDTTYTDIKADYQAVSPYTFAQADEMTYAQSADTIFFAHNEVAPQSLTRTADDVWTFTTLTFVPSISAPGDISVNESGFGGTTRDWFYKIAAINTDGEESSASDAQLAQGDGVWGSGDQVSLFWNDMTSGGYQWTASGSGTAEYYFEASGGGDPSLSEPAIMYENLIEMTAGTLGSLAVGEWDYGDNDSLGFDTVYVRITGGVDPDTKASGYLLFKTSTEDQYAVYKNYRGDWGWLGDVPSPWFLDDNIEGLVSRGPKASRNPFTGAGNYPAAVGIFQQRLCYGRTDNNPQTIWTSQPGAFTNFGISSPLIASDSITATLSTGGSVDEIRHLVPMDKLLTMTEGSEWTFDHGDNSDALSPNNIQFRIQGYNGVSTIAPITVGNEAIYLNRNDKDIRALRFKVEYASYVGNELTLLVPHLFDGKKVVSWCYQQLPDNLFWIILDDGTALTLTYIPEQELWAFARHSTDGLYKRVASITTDGADEVYFSIERTINSSTSNRLEQLASRQIDHIYDAYFVDCGLSLDSPLDVFEAYISATEIIIGIFSHGLSNGDFVHIDDLIGFEADGTNTDYDTFNNKKYKVANVSTNRFELEDIDGNVLTSADGFSGTYKRGGKVRKCVKSVSGLDHLRGESVSVLADGQSIGPLTVNTGTVTLTTDDPGYAVVHVGLPYTCNMQTLRMEITGRNDGTVQGSKKAIRKCTFRFWKSSGGKAGPDADNLLPIKWRQFEDWGDANKMTSDDKDIVIKGTWNKEGRVYFQQDEPLPTSILALITYYEVGGR